MNIEFFGFDNNLKNKNYLNTILIAPHGSGKGVCYVLPALLQYEESCIVHDIKLENYMLTSEYRKSIGHKVFMWNPLCSEGKTHRYNPLDFIDLNEKKIVNDIQKIIELLIKYNEESDYDVYAKNLLLSLILYLAVDNSKPRTFGFINKMLTINDVSSIVDIFNDIKDKFGDKLHSFAKESLSLFLMLSQGDQEVIIATILDYLALWNNPLIDYATSSSDFDIADLKRMKCTLYVGLYPSDIERAEPIMRFFYEHAISRLMNESVELGNSEKNHGVCLFIDELYSLGYMSTLVSCMAYLRGYKIRLFLITSDIDSLNKVYGEYDTNIIISNCANKIIFAPNDYKTADVLSKICLSRSNNQELLSWQELMNLSIDQQIILQSGKDPIISKKEYYYNNSELKDRIKEIKI